MIALAMTNAILDSIKSNTDKINGIKYGAVDFKIQIHNSEITDVTCSISEKKRLTK